MKTYYYVYKVGGDAPKYKHKTRLKAQTEAERLAVKHPGDHFEILACVGISSTPAPKASTFWMDSEAKNTTSKSEHVLDALWMFERQPSELPPTMSVAKWAEKTIAESAAGTVDPQFYRAFMAGAQAGKTGLTLKQIGRVIDDESEKIAAPVRDGDAELPFPDGFPELPPLPKGKTRWAYRGIFPEIPYGAGERCYNSQIRFFNDGAWYVTNAFDGDFHHIEAI